MHPVRITALAALVLTGACASTPAYGPARSGGAGYAEQRIETGRYRVSYTAGQARTAETWALRRAAELTLAEGGSWFAVTDSYSEGDGGAARPRTSVGVGISGGSSGRVSTGVGIGIGLPLGGSGSQVTWTLGILVGSGPRPPGDPRAYDAEEVLLNTAATP